MNLQALDLTVDKADGTPLQKQILKRSLRKLAKRGQVHRMTPLFLYRYCAARLALGDFSDWSGWEWRSEDGWSAKMFYEKQALPRWDGGYAERVWVMGEQGIGDEIFHASLLPEVMVRAKEVVYECDPRLHSVLHRSFPKLNLEPRQDDWSGRSGVFIPSADLLRFFRRDQRHFPAKPYLRVDEERVRSLVRYAGRVGVAFRGRQGSLDPARIELDNPLSLQYGEDRSGLERPDLDLTNDIDGVFALASVLDSVVTVPQTIHHICGAIGKKTSIIIPDIEGEIRNQIPWDYPLGKLPWYPDSVVYPSIKDWKAKCPSKNCQTTTTSTTSAQL